MDSDTTLPAAGAGSHYLPFFWRSPLWIGVQVCRRLAKKTMTTVPVLAPLGARCQRGQWGPQDTAYSLDIFTTYWQHLRAYCTDPSRARVCEVGPGSTLGSPLMFAIAGVRSVLAIDTEYWASLEETIGRAPEIADAMTEAMPWSAEQARGIRGRAASGRYDLRYERQSLDHLSLPDSSIDFLYSNSVLAHVRDLPAAFRCMARVLAPGGVAVHHVDLKDHGFMSSRNPVLMLQIPARLWSFCTAGVPGGINRARLSAYIRAAEGAGLDVTVEKRHTAEGLLVPRRQLAREFRDMPDGDLCTLGATIICKRPTP